MILISNRNGIPTQQSMSYLNSICKSYKGSKFLLIDDPKSTHELDDGEHSHH